MRKYTVYFDRQQYGYVTFEAEDRKEAEEIIENMETHGKFPRDFDHVKDEGWCLIDYDEDGNEGYKEGVRK